VTAANQVKLKPGDTIGILGGGQLGRMLAMAAARLGLRCQVFSPDPDSPAFDVVLNATCAEYADVEALELFANDVDVITYEFENVPAASAMILAARRPVLPDQVILETTQDRLIEKDFVKRLGIGTADYAEVSSAADLRAAIGKIGLPAVLKTRRFGYDGKGQAIIRAGDDPDQVWQDLATRSAILEAFVQFEREISVIAARSADGQVECFDVTENEHSDHILKISRAPAAIPDTLAAQARDVAQRIATALNYVGVLAVEMFVVQGDSGPEVLVNEIAPRVHNSGHWTLDGASISQFEQHIRAIAGWPLGKPVRHGPVTMTNLIGDEILDYEQWLTEPGTTVHLYGKGAPRPGRKMGHVTQVHETKPTKPSPPNPDHVTEVVVSPKTA
jgi:5-(carboxyamino)imidazole ribonucleotide synthase